MRTFFHGFYWQEGIRWRLASSPLMLYKSVGGECHVWLWNDFFVLHDNLLGIGRDRTRSQFRFQEVEVSRHPSRTWLAAANPFALTEGKKPYQKRHPFLSLLYHIESKLSTSLFHSMQSAKIRWLSVLNRSKYFTRIIHLIIYTPSVLSSRPIKTCRESYYHKIRGTFHYAAVSGTIVGSGVFCAHSVSTVLSAFSVGTAVDSAICELELANGCIYLAAQYPS